MRRSAYDARDPALQFWVAATIHDTAIRIVEAVWGPLPPALADELLARNGRLAVVLGLPAEEWPQTRAAFDAAFAEAAVELAVRRRDPAGRARAAAGSGGAALGPARDARVRAGDARHRCRRCAPTSSRSCRGARPTCSRSLDGSRRRGASCPAPSACCPPAASSPPLAAPPDAKEVRIREAADAGVESGGAVLRRT